MRPLGARYLSVVLVGALLLCHGVFGAMHLECVFPGCAEAVQHAADDTLLTGGHGDEHQHPADHGASSEYFAILVVFLGMLLRSLPAVATSRMEVDTPWSPRSRRAPVAARSSPTPTPRTLQVFRL
ncbi:MAG TPA: hypothetical protein VHH10_10875 [Rubrobacteraceae bacterium]|jgi:hypothetical protein|nr:hypothetical protein [Rubrobacteraceae bacterium]